MFDDLLILLGGRFLDISDDLIRLFIEQTKSEVESYCNRPLDDQLKLVCEEIILIKINRYNTEGLSSQSVNGITESYIEGYPAHIKSILDSKRRLKVI